MSEMINVALADIRFGYDRSSGNPSMHFDHVFERGSFSALMGPSGSGKSTLLSLVAGFEVPFAGAIHFGDHDMTRSPPASRPVSVVFQENNLFSHLDSFSNVALGISPSLKLDRAMAAKVADSLSKVGLAGKERRLPSELSGGERQRVALARVLVRQKPVLLLDEAFASLGPGLRDTMLALVRQLHDENQLTTIMVTHNPDDARAASNRLVFIDKGAIVKAGETQAILDNVLENEALRDYLSAAQPTISK